MAEWFFRTMSAGELSIDPVESEFFSTEALDGLTEALVRESIQNTLDATHDGATAQVSFWFSGQECAIQPDNANLVGLRKHVHADGTGLQHPPDFSNGVPFLLIEDFGTTGLCGDPLQIQDAPGKNNFYYFWRNIGRSGKQESERGRWGLGKNVFAASSRINSFLGFTERAETPGALLMGQSVLKVHLVDGERKYPYGYFAETGSDQLAIPIQDPVAIKQFKTDFSLQRDGETGLSIAVLFPDPEITPQGILASVLRQYFYPIMKGLLSIRITSNGSETLVEQSTLQQCIAGMNATFRHDLEPLLRLAEWSLSAATPTHVSAGDAGYAPRWQNDLIASTELEALRQRFERGDMLAFEIPLSVKANKGPEQTTKFLVYVQRDLAMESHRPTFVREGLIITDATRSKLRGAHALVIIEDKPLAAFLGDAENPAHTEWQSRSAHFKDRYRHGPTTLKYVKEVPWHIVQSLTLSDEEQDLSALADVFFVESPDDNDKRPGEQPVPKPGPDTPIPDPPEPPEPRPIRISKVEGGFVVTAMQALAAAHVTAAYEVRRGNAFRRYHTADFEFGKEPLQIDTENTEVIEAKGNEISVGPFVPGSKLTVTGFDPLRDLAVKLALEE